MSTVVLLDSSPLWLATNPKALPEADACSQWVRNMLARPVIIGIPEIIYYEASRKLLFERKVNHVNALAQLRSANLYVPLTTGAMDIAAQLWAEARQRGHPQRHLKILTLMSFLQRKQKRCDGLGIV